MQIVILAAGKGTRLGLSEPEVPKSLVSITAKRTYLSYQLESLKNFKFSKKIFIGGFGFDLLTKFLNEQNDKSSTLVYNSDYHKGNLYSLLAGRDQVSTGFFLFNADHYYSLENYKKIFVEDRKAITIFCDKDRALTDDDMKVSLSSDQRLVKMAKNLTQYDCGYVGVTYIPEAKLKDYWQASDETAQNLGEQANVEAVLNHLAAKGEKIDFVDISGSWWTEIDTPEDLVRAREVISRNK